MIPFSTAPRIVCICTINSPVTVNAVINPEIYLKTPKHNLYVGLHNYHNFNKSFLGIELGTNKESVNLFNKTFLIDSRLILWSQPENQTFKTNNSDLGGLIGAKIHYPLLDWLNGYVDLEAKSKGWVAGNPFLKSSFSFRLGCSMRILN